MISTKMTMMPEALIDNEEKMAIIMTGLIIIIERLSMTFTGNGKRQDEIFFFAKTRRNLIF